MLELKRTLLAAILSAAVMVVAVPTATADEPKVKKPEQPTAEPGKTIIIQIDASKLPPDVLKELLKLSGTPTKPGTKPEPTKPGAEPAKPGTKPEPTKPEPTKPGVKPGTEPVKPGIKPDTKPGTKPEPTKPGAEPVKPGTKPGTKPEPTKTVKAISLTDAIALAEKATQGTVVKAERKDEDGKVQFKLDVIDGKGGKSKVTIDAGGKVTLPEKTGEDEKGKKKEEDEKGKKKKKDD